MSQSQKDKLSYINTGKKLSPSTKQKISRSMTKYWSKLPFKPVAPSTGDTSSGTTTPPSSTTGV